MASTEQFVGLKRKLSRSIVTATPFSRSGMPWRIVGSGSASITRWASFGSTRMAARTTTSPRSNGPATARTAIDRPKGAPLYGPVRYTGPEIANGADPAPEATVEKPILLSSPHEPAAACSSAHSGTLARIPSRPGGCCTDRPLRYCCPSSRERKTANGENAPASGLDVPAWKSGVNGGVAGQAPPLPSASTGNVLVGLFAAVPEYGVSALVVVAAPQASGLASAACGPPLNFSVKSLNGTCGVSAKVVVS